MSVTEFTFRILFVFFPGIVAHLVVDALTEHPRRESFQVILYAFIFGVSSYLLLIIVSHFLSFVCHIFSWHYEFSVSFFSFIEKDEGKPKIPLSEVIYATVLAFPLSFIVSALLNYKILHRVAQIVRVSKKFGDSDVWGFTFTMEGIEWVIVRDIKHNLAYEGWVQAFSPTFTQNEILLRDVKVFRNDDTSKELYSIGGLYISRESNDLTIELAMPLTELENRPSKGGDNIESTP